MASVASDGDLAFPNSGKTLGASSLDTSSVTSLRASVSSLKRSGDAAWIQLNGLPLEDGRAHSALCHALARFGLGAELGAHIPKAAVLDWSNVDGCSAEGVAFFAVLVRHLLAKGVRVIACRPADGAIAAVLERAGILVACGPITWVKCAACTPSAVEAIAPAAVFGSESNDSVFVFCDELSAALKRLALTRSVRQAVMGTTQELLQNVLSHASASHAAAMALLLPRKRPKVLQIGVADDGLGIPGSVLRQERYRWLGWFHDASVTEVVLSQALSGRPSTAESANGGGMARIIKRLLRETTSTVMLRSSAALITLRSNAPDRFERRALTYGAGTQIRVELRLS